MKKNLKAALYDPFFDILGGGEKHILSILQVLEKKGYEINIFWDKDLTNEINNKLALQFIDKLKFLPNIFCESTSQIKKLLTLNNFDYFFYVSDGSYFFSTAKKNFVFCMVPQKSLYPMNLFNKLKTANYRFIANSEFTQKWLRKWGVESEVIYPYLNKEFTDIEVKNINKDKIILSVGRFYKHLHSKRHDILINWFKKIKQKNDLFKDFILILVGGLKEEDNDYFKQLKKLAGNDQSIKLMPNLSYKELVEIYRKSLIYLHTAGYGVDEGQNPEKVEHLGIAPLEAMASGCMTFCYKSGGVPEIIKDGINGFLYVSLNELEGKLIKISNDSEIQSKIKINAAITIKEKFNYRVFEKRVLEVIKP